MTTKIDLDIMRRDIRVSRAAFDGTNRPLDIPVRIWIDEAEKLTNEVDELRAENERLRAALQEILDCDVLIDVYAISELALGKPRPG